MKNRTARARSRVVSHPVAVFRSALAGALAIAFCAAGTAGAAPADRAHDKAQITLNLKDADLGTLIQTVSEVTGKNFIVDPRVRGKVTVISSTPMDPGGVYETFLSVLQTQGFATAPAGEAIKIIPEANARQEGGTYISSGEDLPGDELVTHVYAIKNASSVQLVNVLRPLVAQGGQLAAYTPGNIIIISDRAANVERIGKIIEQIDVTGDRDIEIVPLENAGADDVVKALSTLSQQDRASDPTARPPAIIADERSNSILISGDREDREKLKAIIKELDEPLKEDSSTQVILLKYADAMSLAPILQGQAPSATSSSSHSSGSMFGSGSSGLGSSSGLGGGSSMFGEHSGMGSSASSAPSTPTYTGSSGGSSTLFDHATIVPDKDTNALIITAAPKTMRLIRSVIAQLDVERRQVLVDAIIAEISADKSSQLGVDWAVYNPHSIALAGILNDSTLAALQTAASAAAQSTGSTPTTSQLAGAAAGLLGQGITGGGGLVNQNGTSFGLLLKALSTDGDTNILSTPSLTVLDNEEAKMSVGQEIPIETGQFSNTGTGSISGSVNPFQTFDREDVGFSLGITPTITYSNSITLKIQLEDSSLGSGIAGTANVVTNKRTIDNMVTVHDGQILVLGGLIDNELTDSQNKVPVLGDIPLIGSLFHSHDISKTRQNLMVFIHPVILHERGDSDYYSRIKYNSVRNSEVGAATSAVPMVGGHKPLLNGYDEYMKQNNRPDQGGAAPAVPGQIPPTSAAPPAAPTPKDASPGAPGAPAAAAAVSAPAAAATKSP